jgi:energy-coupling factor transport system ATP-binding protein
MNENIPILTIENLTHKYSAGTPFETTAIEDINVTVNSGEMMAVIGHTGSGKSTFIQHLNGLLKPTSGRVLFRARISQLQEDDERRPLQGGAGVPVPGVSAF